MSFAAFTAARKDLHASLISQQVLGFVKKTKGANPLVVVPTFADSSQLTSLAIARGLLDKLGVADVFEKSKDANTLGKIFETACNQFLVVTFMKSLGHIRPGEWELRTNRTISDYLQYEHLSQIQMLAEKHPALKVLIGTEYLITGDILIARKALKDEEINLHSVLVDSQVAVGADLRMTDLPPLLHASVSCKWTLRSDRAQNARSEALNLIRNRKGRAPHIAIVTAEPSPARLGSLALGTGDIDCVYHIALPELVSSVEAYAQSANGESQKKLRTNLVGQLWTMINGRRLKDISDLPLDLAT